MEICPRQKGHTGIRSRKRLLTWDNICSGFIAYETQGQWIHSRLLILIENFRYDFDIQTEMILGIRVSDHALFMDLGKKLVPLKDGNHGEGGEVAAKNRSVW